MQIAKNKNTAIAISILLIVSMSASMLLLPAAQAHLPAWQIPTFAYINVAPNPVGVGQSVNVLMWLDKTYGTNPAINNNFRFRNYQLTITKPDNTTDQVTFAQVNDTTSSQYYRYTPTMTGQYTFFFNFPGQNYNTSVTGQYDPTSIFVNDTFLASNATTTITVQQDQLPTPITSYTLPSEYWTRPIYGENTDWWTISSNWLGTGAPGYSGFSFGGSAQMSFPGDAVGPATSHVMWTKSYQDGGVAGGDNFAIQGDTLFEGSAYNQRYTNPIILAGKIYFSEWYSFTNVPGSFTGGGYGPTTCIDLRTGQTIWTRSDVPQPSFGYLYDVQNPNQHGVFPPMLVASTGSSFFASGSASWSFYDADTGNFMLTAANVPSGTTVLGPNGEQLIYAFIPANQGNTTAPGWRLCQWNSSRLWIFADPVSGTLSPTVDGPLVSSGPFGNVYNGTYVDAQTAVRLSSRFDYNVSTTFLNSMPQTANFGTLTVPCTILAANYGDKLICMNGTFPGVATSQFGTTSSAPYTYFAINLNASKQAVGSLLWKQLVQPASGNVTVLPGPVDFTTGVFTEAYKETRQWVGYSMVDGSKVWGPTPSQAAFDYYGTPAVPQVQGVSAYGKLYSSGFAGICYCYDMATGNLLWTYGNGGAGNSTNSGYYTAYGDYPTFINAIGQDPSGNKVVYLITTEHTVTTPIYKGALARAISADDGTELWTLSDYTGEFFTQSVAIADGFETFFNGYDNNVYSVGRGPSATTVSAPATGAEFKTPVVISGTVTDISSGTTQQEQAARFPHGVPVADDSIMKDWMGYVYQQKPALTSFTGVNVVLSVVDPNNNMYNIGNATTDQNGQFSLAYTPEVAGKYTVIATFQGTNAYWPSKSESTFNVMEQPQATAAPTPTPTSVVEQYFVPAVAGIFILIIIATAIIILATRKRA